jgi:hypothetical protein
LVWDIKLPSDLPSRPELVAAAMPANDCS